MTSSAAVVKSYHRSQLLVRSEFDDKPATPSDDANNATSSNLLRIGPLVEVLKLPGGTAANVLSDDGWSPPPIVSGANMASASRRTVTHKMSKALSRVAIMLPRQLS